MNGNHGADTGNTMRFNLDIFDYEIDVVGDGRFFFCFRSHNYLSVFVNRKHKSTEPQDILYALIIIGWNNTYFGFNADC